MRTGAFPPLPKYARLCMAGEKKLLLLLLQQPSAATAAVAPRGGTGRKKTSRLQYSCNKASQTLLLQLRFPKREAQYNSPSSSTSGACLPCFAALCTSLSLFPMQSGKAGIITPSSSPFPQGNDPKKKKGRKILLLLPRRQRQKKIRDKPRQEENGGLLGRGDAASLSSSSSFFPPVVLPNITAFPFPLPPLSLVW